MLEPSSIRKPKCPYCYDGEIVKDSVNDEFFCPECEMKVEMVKTVEYE